MGGFERQVKARTNDLKRFFNKSAKIVGNSCKKGWYKIKHVRK